MKRILLLSCIALPVMFILDLTWVGIIANTFYRSQLGYLYSPHTVWWAAIAFYVIYILGLVYFVIAPGLTAGSLKKTLLNAAFFALVAYGTYDLTSLAITTNWPLLMTFVDMTWGIVCALITTTITFVVAKTFLSQHPPNRFQCL
jgi:uncharacterized membrane protein